VVAHMIGGNEELSRPVRLIRRERVGGAVEPAGPQVGEGPVAVVITVGDGEVVPLPVPERDTVPPALLPSLAQHVLQALVAPPQARADQRAPPEAQRFQVALDDLEVFVVQFRGKRAEKPREALGREARGVGVGAVARANRALPRGCFPPGLRVAPHRPRVGTGDEARLNRGARRRVPDVPELPLMASAKRSPSQRGGPRCNPPCTCGSSS
jgi:hypothetical protein